VDQSVSQTLHTASVHILSAVVDAHLSSSESEQTTKLLRRTLTALIHHCKSSVEFAAIAQYSVAKLKELGSASSTENDISKLGRLLDVVYFVCAVRNGSRLSRKFPNLSQPAHTESNPQKVT
jgi:U3 small nucleolar RNA-associated protein 20